MMTNVGDPIVDSARVTLLLEGPEDYVRRGLIFAAALDKARELVKRDDLPQKIEVTYQSYNHPLAQISMRLSWE